MNGQRPEIGGRRSGAADERLLTSSSRPLHVAMDQPFLMPVEGVLYSRFPAVVTVDGPHRAWRVSTWATRLKSFGYPRHQEDDLYRSVEIVPKAAGPW